SDDTGVGVRTSEIGTGFGCPTLANSGAIDPAVVRSLGLERHGLSILKSEAAACAPGKDGRALVLWRDTARAAEEIRAWSPKDAAQYPRFLDSVANVSAVLRALLASPPPSIDGPSAGELVDLL